MNIRKILLLTFLVAMVSGCFEVSSVEYIDRHDAESRKAIGESKWLPTWLPEDAVNIRETHDVDTNESWLVFNPRSGSLALPVTCKPISVPEKSSEYMMRRFPRFAQDAWSRASGRVGIFYLCPEIGGERWVMYDKELNLVYSRAKF
ncbi:hypothetical protein [Xanthomonas sp. 1678]|uniref:hypothetical protein n=1 Tax=Xanthomonas sp. 1678 TaxID=3158788 RepID=UPI002860B3A7|nr:hypothetical protein [Xanthomonas translucens]